MYKGFTYSVYIVNLFSNLIFVSFSVFGIYKMKHEEERDEKYDGYNKKS